MSKKLVQFTSQQDVQLIPSGITDKYLKRTSDNSGWELITGSLSQALSYGTTTDGYNIDLNLGSYLFSSDGYVTVNDVLDVSGEIRTGQGLVLTEQASRPDNGTSTTGVVWVRDDNKLIFTDQNNNDNVLDTSSGTSTIDFGVSWTDMGSISVTGQTGILTTSSINLYIYGSDSTADHSSDEHMLASTAFILIPTNIIAGTGFTINVLSSELVKGQFKIRWTWQ